MGACTLARRDDDPESTSKKGPMSASAPPPSFEGLGIDAKILQALHKRKLERPTAVQAACIPKALLGRDLVATARTGAGKTVAYLVPALQRLLETAEGTEGGKGGKGKGKRRPFQTLILVPTRELCEQVLQEAKLLALACSGAIRVTSLNGEGRTLQQSATTAGQIVVATPGRVAELIRSGVPVLGEHLSFMVLDEADLLLSYGYEEDMDVIAPCVPRSCQCMLLSATTSDDVLKLTKLVLTNPVSLDLTNVGVSRGDDGNVDSGGEGEDGGQVGGADVDHRELALPASCGKAGSLAGMTERLLLLLTLLKFGLVDKKVLIFVNSPDVGMRARLFLDAFGIQCSELHAEMPLNTRNHVLQQFNKGLFDYLIATDDVYVSRDAAKGKPTKGKGPGARAPAKSKNEEAGVTRGIDFRGVKTVINLEMPPSVPGYVHRVGRTGRGGESGTAVTLFSTSHDDEMREKIKENLQRTQKLDLKTFDKVTKAAVEGLRYRAEDVARSITKSVIREARTKDIKTELMNSKRLEEFFEERPADLRLIKHDRSVASSVASAAAPHLKHVPGYLRDPLLQGKSFVGRPGNGFLPARKRRKTDAKIDPVKGFMKAPRKGEVEATAMELRAEESAKRERKRLKKKGVLLPGEDTFVKKRNVRKKR